MIDEFKNDVNVEPAVEQAVQEEITPLQTCQAELAQLKEKYLYLAADFDTFRRRTVREADQRAAAVEKKFAEGIITFVDDFERALNELQRAGDDTTFQQWLTGFGFVEKSLHKLLTEYGITEITENGMFNPQYHEAIMQAPSEGKPTGTIVTVFQKGYRLKGQVLRPTRVSVAQ